MPQRTHYESLGVSPRASADEIRAAYRSLAQKLHPDVSEANDAHGRFAEIADAYRVLSDAVLRRAYDNALQTGPPDESILEPGPAAGPHYTWTNIASGSSHSGDERTEFDDMYDAFFGS